MDRAIKPYEQVKTMLKSASPAWEKLLGHIRYYYIMDEQWAEGKPTHKHYNNLFVRRSGKSFIMFAIREGYFKVCVVLGKNERDKFDQARDTFSEAVCKVYDQAETLHDGKWLGFDMYDDTLINDIIHLLHIKRKPNRKILPQLTEDKCGCLDIGLSHEDISKLVQP